MVSKFERHHFSGLPHSPHSLDISAGNFWLFVMMKKIVTNSGFNSNDEIEEAIASAGNDLTFDDVQGFCHNWINSGYKRMFMIICPQINQKITF
jgi:hypothetical protein